MIFEEEGVIVTVGHGFEKEAKEFQVAHLSKSSVASENETRNYAETFCLDILREKKVLRIQDAFIEATQLIKALSVKKHKGTRTKRSRILRAYLNDAVSEIH